MSKGNTAPFGLTDVTYAFVWKVIKNWRKSDTYRGMKREVIIFIAPRIAWLISLIAIVAHAYWVINSKISMNFSRCGAVITLMTAALYAVLDWHDPKATVLSGAKIKSIKIFDPYITLPILAVIGTAVWGYGDWLLEKFFPDFGWKH